MRQPEESSPLEGSDVDGPTEITRAGEDWPVSPQYRVTRDPVIEGQTHVERGTVAARPRRRRPLPSGPTAAVTAAVVALLVLLGAATAWLVTSDEPSRATAPPPAEGTTITRDSTSPAASTSPPSSSTSTSEEKPPQVAVPGVLALAVSDAGREIGAARLRVQIRFMPSSQEAGTVIAQDPSGSEQVGPKSVVSLVVAKSVAPAAVRMPGVVGSTAADAKSRLRELELHWSVSEVASDEARLTVVGQTPAAGTEVRKGQMVTLKVSTGPALVAVSDVTGLDEQSARRTLEGAGFEVTVVDQPTSDPAKDGTVVAQDPIGGAKADKGSAVTITVARLS